MAPEQMKGKPADARSDQYAIGVLLYHCLTGRPPYEHQKGSDVMAVLAAVQEGGFPPLRELQPAVSEALEAVVLRAMSRDPEDRFASVAELGRALEPFAPARVRDRWRRYFAEANTLSTGPQTLMPTTAVSTAGLTVNERGANAARTLAEADIVTAADPRFTSTTAVATPTAGEGTTAAAGPPSLPSAGGAQDATPWAVSDALAVVRRPGGRRVAVAVAGGAAMLGAVLFWTWPSRVQPSSSVSVTASKTNEGPSTTAGGAEAFGQLVPEPLPVAPVAVRSAAGATPDASPDVTISRAAETTSGAGVGTGTMKGAPASKRRRAKEASRRGAVEILKDGTPNLLP